jgi:cardiolipin synthase
VLVLWFGASCAVLFMAATWFQGALFSFSLALVMAGLAFGVNNDANHRAHWVSSHSCQSVKNDVVHPSEGLPAASVALTFASHPASVPESVKLLDGGAQAYPRMLLAIARAKRNVHLEVYAFVPSGVGARFVEALGQAASRGVKVEVQIDGWGSLHGGRAVVAALREAGCTARIYNRLIGLLVGRFGRNHRKILLLDDEVAFLGGINIGDENVGQGEHPGWADLALEIRGPQCVRLGQMIRREPQRQIDSSLRIFLCGLGGGWRLRRRYLKAFASARQRIHVAHGYFLPDRGVVRAITSAARRGVQVRLLLAGRSDVPFARAATRSLYRRLLAMGVDIHEWSDSVLHAKVATVDGRRLLVGSFNLDPFSLANLETLVEVDDTRVVEKGEAWIQDHFARSRQVTSVEAGSWLRRWLLDPLGRIVARLAEAFGRVIASRKRRRASPDLSKTGRRSRPPKSKSTNTTSWESWFGSSRPAKQEPAGNPPPAERKWEPMALETARDIMIPLDQYAVVEESATMVDALHALDRVQQLVPEGRHPHRAVLVRDRNANIVGKLGHHAFLSGLEPRYLEIGKPQAFTHQGYSRSFLLEIMEHMSLWSEDSDTYVRRAISTKVADVMHPVVEYVDIDAPIAEVIHKLIMYSSLSLVVTEGDNPVGMVRLADVFSVVAENIKRTAAGLEDVDASRRHPQDGSQQRRTLTMDQKRRGA